MPNPNIPPSTGAKTHSQADAIIAAQAGQPGGLLTILEKLQELNRHKYLPAETLKYVALKTGTPLSQVYSVATFYSFFNLQPQGDHTVCICRGTACHARGSRNLLNNTKLMLGIDARETEKAALTTPDKRFTVRTVACFGQCALAPVVEVDREIYGRMNERELRKVVGNIGE